MGTRLEPAAADAEGAAETTAANTATAKAAATEPAADAAAKAAATDAAAKATAAANAAAEPAPALTARATSCVTEGEAAKRLRRREDDAVRTRVNAAADVAIVAAATATKWAYKRLPRYTDVS